ncbi:MAG: HNH endonuclease [Candidatus Eremiobacteraeota bacterium]|nr:HNH endonuclease [Candidatus Eremiobacteraeota bacterium]
MGVRVDWTAVQLHHDGGNDRRACMERFGFAAAAWYKAVRRGKLRVTLAPRYDWAAVQYWHEQGHSVRACARHFGFSMAAWTKASRRGLVRARGLRKTVEELAAKAPRNRHIIKRRLIAEGKLQNICAICGIADWKGRPLSLQLDHVNGNGLDYRLENLRILCPNCHSQTETFAGRNRKNSRSRLV